MSPCEGQRTKKSFLAETDTAIAAYGNALDVLTQQCWDLISQDAWVAVHELVDKAGHISADVGNICDVVNGIEHDVWHALDGVRHVEDAICHALNSIDDIKDGVSTLGKVGPHGCDLS